MTYDANQAREKRLRQLRTEYSEKISEIAIEPSEKEGLIEIMIMLSKEAWVRGKDYGWKKAWHWKRKNNLIEV